MYKLTSTNTSSHIAAIVLSNNDSAFCAVAEAGEAEINTLESKSVLNTLLFTAASSLSPDFPLKSWPRQVAKAIHLLLSDVKEHSFGLSTEVFITASYDRVPAAIVVTMESSAYLSKLE